MGMNGIPQGKKAECEMNTKGVGRCLSQKEREIQTNGRVWVIEAKGEEAPEERSIGQMLGPLGLCKA